MGPERDELPTFKRERMAAVKNVAKKTVEKYFADPVHYLFYGLFSCMTVGLLFNASFPLQLYIILFVLAAIKIYTFYYERTK